VILNRRSGTVSSAIPNATTVQIEQVEVGDRRYAYRQLRPSHPVDPTPVVFLHRFRGTLDDWDPQFVDELAKTRHVILFSDAGIGSSTGPAARSVDEKARNAATFIRALGYQQVDVLGFSLGGFVCQAIALLEPKLIRKVVIIGAGAGGNPEAAPPTEIVFSIAMHENYDLADNRYLFFAEGRDKETQAYMDRIAARTVGREPVVTQDVIGTMVELISAFMGGQTGHYARLGELKQPVFIVSGDKDPFFPLKNQWILFRELPNARLSVYPQAGHGAHQQHPVEVAAEVEEFLTVA
jgi:pimeloyl-ACP methyl ester carboxylesterase